jgi:hypothetical protein
MCGTTRVARKDATYCSRKCTYRAANLRLNYGISPLRYRQMLDEQGNACPICKRSFTEVAPHIDHDHGTGAVRSILCSPCNVAIGMLNEDPVRAIRLAKYLRAHAK